jgi:IS4 transposase
MILDPVLQKFAEKRPIAVMLRTVLENQFSAAALDRIFAETARTQYERDLAFSACAQLFTQVVLGPHATVHAAFVRDREQIPVTIGALYAKLKGIEPAVLGALVDQTGTALAAVGGHLTTLRTEPVPGYRLRAVDGNVLAGTDHRPGVTRDTNAAALPGQSVVLYEYATGLIRQVLPWENAHTNERALMSRVAEWVGANDLILADRNFCTPEFLGAVAGRGGAFLVRRHAGTTVPTGDGKAGGRCRTGQVFEAPATLSNGLTCRAIRIVRDKPLKDGGSEVMLLTSVSGRIRARTLANLYLERWTVEEAFRQLTQYLGCEVKTLGYPRAALFAFTLAVLAYNALACVRSALASVRGRKRVASQVSAYYLACEVRAAFDGLQVAVPAEAWTNLAALPPAALAAALIAIAGHVDWRCYQKARRGPKRPTARKKVRRGGHMATQKLLNQRSANHAAAT